MTPIVIVHCVGLAAGRNYTDVRRGQKETVGRSWWVPIAMSNGSERQVFLNPDPHEPLDEGLLNSLEELRDRSGDRQLVLEVHEEAVPDAKSSGRFASALRDLDVLLAFHDFGAGQSHLLELARIKPDFLKFDRSLVKDPGSPEASHVNLVKSLHDSAVSLGIRTLAEGLETASSIAACEQIGFELYQGYAFGRPAPLESLLD